MSLWTSIRDTVESIGSVAANYLLPGSSFVIDPFLSQGAQQQLNTPIGMLANLGSGLSGAGVGSSFTGIPAASDIGAGWGNAASGLGSALGMDTNFAGTPSNPWSSMPWLGDGSAGVGIPGTTTAGGMSSWVPGMTADSSASPWYSSASNIFDKLKSMGSLGSSGGVSTATGLYGLYQAQQMQALARQLQASADPFAGQRAQYAQQLSALQANPSSIANLPGYQAGLDAVQRSMAAQGYQGSGNMMAALQNYGGNIYDQQMQTLAGLAGAGANPASAAQIGLMGQKVGMEAGGNAFTLLAKGLGA